jgi:hypothetical protein
MSPAQAGEGFTREDSYAGYHVVDRTDHKVGTVEAVFLDNDNQRELVEVERGLLGRALGTGAFLIPMEICTVDDDDRTIRVSADKDMLKHSPPLDAAAEVVTRGHETVVRAHFGL